MGDTTASGSKSATRALASMIGVFGGLMAVEHGYLETLQGTVAPRSMIIDAVGRQPGSVFQGSEPAVTIIPNFFATGVVAIIVGLLVTIWAAAFVQRRNGVPVMILLSVALFLVGGGLVPLVIVIISGAVATRIGKPLTWWRTHLSLGLRCFLARLWPWPFVVFFLSSLINLQIAVFGSFFGVTKPSFSPILVPSILGLLLLSVASGFAYDIQRQTDSHQAQIS